MRSAPPIALALAAALAAPSLAAAQGLAPRDVYGGVRLSERERQQVVERIRLPDGRIVERTENYGFPAFFGIGDVRGAPGSQPLVNGVTNSVRASTPSGGLVPGQEPE